jgi:hypothetical protein
MKKLLIFCTMAALYLMHNAHALLLCSGLASPSSCSNQTVAYSVNSNRVYNCTGSTVTEFEVWGGCGPNRGLGDYYYNPREQTPAGVQPATNPAGEYCYCQLKSINGGADLPGSSWWVFDLIFGNADGCAYHCAIECASTAQLLSGFRSALFSAAGF